MSLRSITPPSKCPWCGGHRMVYGERWRCQRCKAILGLQPAKVEA